MGHSVTKPVLGVSDKMRFKPVCSATELVASLDMILFNKRITKALIKLRGCAGWSAPLLFANPRRHVFLRRGPYDAFQKANNKGTDQTAWMCLKCLPTLKAGFLASRCICVRSFKIIKRG